MVTEQVKEIKTAEAKAEQILKDAEQKASVIKSSLSDRIQKLGKAKDGYINKESREYRSAAEQKKEREIQKLTKQYNEKKEFVSQQYQKRSNAVADAVWEYITKEVFRQ